MHRVIEQTIGKQKNDTKLAELGGNMPDCWESIDAKKLKNKIHFL